MSSSEGDEQLPDDLLAPDGDDEDAGGGDAPGIEGEEHLGLTPPD